MEEKRRPSDAGNEQNLWGKLKRWQNKGAEDLWAPRVLVTNAPAFSLQKEELQNQVFCQEKGKKPKQNQVWHILPGVLHLQGVCSLALSEAWRAENHTPGTRARLRPLAQPRARSGQDRGPSVWR